MFGLSDFKLADGFQQVESSGMIISMLLVISFWVFSVGCYCCYFVTGKLDWDMRNNEPTENLQFSDTETSQRVKGRARKTNAEKKRLREKMSTEAEDDASNLATTKRKLEAAEKENGDLQKINGAAEKKNRDLQKTIQDLEKDASERETRCREREAELVHCKGFYTSHINESKASNARIVALVKQLQAHIRLVQTHNLQLQDKINQSRQLGPEQVASIHSPWSKNFRMEDLRKQIAHHEDRAKEVESENQNKLREKNNRIRCLKEMIEGLKDEVEEREFELEFLGEFLLSWEPIITKWTYYTRTFDQLRSSGFYHCRDCLVWHHIDNSRVPSEVLQHDSAERTILYAGGREDRTLELALARNHNSAPGPALDPGPGPSSAPPSSPAPATTPSVAPTSTTSTRDGKVEE